MRSLLHKSHAALLLSFLLAASYTAAGQSLSKSHQVPDDTIHQHIERGIALERIGLYTQAEAEYLAALAVADPAARMKIAEGLERVRKAQLLAETAKADRQSEKNFKLGEELQRRRQYDQAIQAFQRAYNQAGSAQVQAHARVALVHAIEDKNSFWLQLVQNWAMPAAKVVLLLAASVLLLVPALRFFYWALGFIGHLAARYSKRIEVADFEDTTDTGFGKGFPALLRTLYYERQQIARPDIALVGSGIVTYRQEDAAFPIMSSSRYEDFSEVKLNVAGMEVSGLMGKATRRLFQPYYSLEGAIYRYNNEIRATAKIAKYNGVVGQWELILSDSKPGGAIPSDSAYQLIDAIIRDWRQQ